MRTRRIDGRSRQERRIRAAELRSYPPGHVFLSFWRHQPVEQVPPPAPVRSLPVEPPGDQPRLCRLGRAPRDETLFPPDRRRRTQTARRTRRATRRLADFLSSTGG